MAFLLVSAAPAAVNDLYPTDFYGVAEGHGTIAGYVFDRKQIGNYVNGRHLGEIAITSHIGALRMSRCFSLAGWKVAPVMVISGAEAELSGRSVPHGIATHASGYADLRIGGTIGLIDEPRERNFLAINVATVWPTGQYEKSALLNIGENRRRQALTLGWVKGFGKDLTLELSPEWAWYQSNTEACPGNVQFDQRRGGDGPGERLRRVDRAQAHRVVGSATPLVPRLPPTLLRRLGLPDPAPLDPSPPPDSVTPIKRGSWSIEDERALETPIACSLTKRRRIASRCGSRGCSRTRSGRRGAHRARRPVDSVAAMVMPPPAASDHLSGCNGNAIH